MSRRPIQEEKRTYRLNVLVGETLYRHLQDLAALRNRSLSDYVNHRLLLDTYGESLAVQRQADSQGVGDEV